ncbi:MAG: hypothetical protein JRN28_00320 [Nitrososphaerota archaeon]|nr:hypothetical protein [Nitrososphaerota archaeon]
MPKGLWVWPVDSRGQRSVLRQVAASPHLMAALTALVKSKEGGMSNAELHDAISDSAEWTTLWVVRQLTSLGFIVYKVDFFGNPARYQLTDQGRVAFSTITGQPLPKPAAPAPNPVPQPAASPPAAPRPPPAAKPT